MPESKPAQDSSGLAALKSLEALLDKPNSAVGKSDDIVSKEPEVSSKCHGKMMDSSCQGRSQNTDPVEKQTLFVTPLQPSKDEDEVEESFHVHQKAALEHRATEKEYIKVACEAFIEGDRPRSRRLMEQAAFFSQKAREAADESIQNIVDTSI